MYLSNVRREKVDQLLRINILRQIAHIDSASYLLDFARFRIRCNDSLLLVMTRNQLTNRAAVGRVVSLTRSAADRLFAALAVRSHRSSVD